MKVGPAPRDYWRSTTLCSVELLVSDQSFPGVELNDVHAKESHADSDERTSTRRYPSSRSSAREVSLVTASV